MGRRAHLLLRPVGIKRDGFRLTMGATEEGGLRGGRKEAGEGSLGVGTWVCGGRTGL